MHVAYSCHSAVTKVDSHYKCRFKLNFIMYGHDDAGPCLSIIQSNTILCDKQKSEIGEKQCTDPTQMVKTVGVKIQLNFKVTYMLLFCYI